MNFCWVQRWRTLKTKNWATWQIDQYFLLPKNIIYSFPKIQLKHFQQYQSHWHFQNGAHLAPWRKLCLLLLNFTIRELLVRAEKERRGINHNLLSASACFFFVSSSSNDNNKNKNSEHQVTIKSEFLRTALSCKQTRTIRIKKKQVSLLGIQILNKRKKSEN